jgi:hypothetical protein
MKQVEIKRFNPLNTGKVMVYMMAVPAVLCFLVGLVMVPVGILIHKTETTVFGVIVGLGYPVMFIVMYSIMGIIQAYLYNWFAGKYGGLIIEIDEKNDVQ